MSTKLFLDNRTPTADPTPAPQPAPVAQPPAAPAQLLAPNPGETSSQPGSSLNHLLNPDPAHNCQLATINHQPPTVIDAKPLPAAPPRKIRRNGRIASLPKLQLDMVGRMLWNNVAYKNIVAALDELDFTVTERNISNWVTRGGYLEWRLEQEAALQNRLDQDRLVDFLRRDDASELPEVGLQAAATRLSQLMLQKLTQADNVEANLPNFSQMVDVLCRLNREIATLQKQRDDSRRSLGPAHDPARIKDHEQAAVIEHERFYSNPPSDSTLPKPPVPPLLPPIPTSEILAQGDREVADARKAEHAERFLRALRASSAKKAPAATDPKVLPPPEAAR